MDRLRELLAADVTIYADGGGKATSHGPPVAGISDAMSLFEKFASVFAANKSRLVRYGFINGLPGFVTMEAGDVLQTTALQIEDGRVAAVYVVRNPDKLKSVANAVH